MIRNYRQIGKAGEHRVISELLLRGHKPMLAVIDEGVDIVLENGTRLQVRTVTKGGYDSRRNSASITTTHIGYENGKRVKKLIPQRADYFIAWVTPWDEFFVIPIIEVKRRQRTLSISRNCKKPGSLYLFKDRWDLLGAL